MTLFGIYNSFVALIVIKKKKKDYKIKMSSLPFTKELKFLLTHGPYILQEKFSFLK